MRASLNGCLVWVDDVVQEWERATVAYERGRPGLFVIRARDAGVRVGHFRERLRVDGAEVTSNETNGRERRVRFTLLSDATYGEDTLPAGTTITCVCVAGCSSCGKKIA